jgi:hypothetical protein
VITTIRKSRRDRPKNRIARQKREDLIAQQLINKSMMWSMNTDGGTRCPECQKSLPARALTNLSGRFNGGFITAFGIKPDFCHRDISICFKEAKEENER